MPFDAKQGPVTIKGMYPNARYFSFVTYDTNNQGGPADVADSVYDAKIAPDPGSINPFVQPHKATHQPVNGVNGTYTVVIKQGGQTSGNTTANTVRVSTDFAWVVLRVYVPNPDPSLSGQNLTGGVPLPTIFLTGNGGTQKLNQCSPVNKLVDMGAVLSMFYPPGVELKGDEGTPSSDRLWFAPPKVPPPVLLPNPDNKYVAMMPGNNYQPGRIIVIHGKAPGYPNTYDGSPIWAPAPGFRTVDTRFWSVCNNDFAFPFTAVACTSDLTTDLEGGYYTVVISDDLLRPDWLRPNINWLPWGDREYLKLVFFRNLLTAPNFQFSIQKAMDAGCTFEFELPYVPLRNEVDSAGQCAQGVMRNYYPVAVWCDKSTFIHGGWQACIKGQ